MTLQERMLAPLESGKARTLAKAYAMANGK